MFSNFNSRRKMDYCKLAVDSVLIGFGAAAVYVCAKAGLKKWANARKHAAERRAAHAKGEQYWQDVDWVKFAEDSGKLPQGPSTSPVSKRGPVQRQLRGAAFPKGLLRPKRDSRTLAEFRRV